MKQQNEVKPIPVTLIHTQHLPAEVNCFNRNLFPLFFFKSEMPFNNFLKKTRDIVVKKRRTSAKNNVTDHTKAPHVHLFAKVKQK
jgi:hypothetical protein